MSSLSRRGLLSALGGLGGAAIVARAPSASAFGDAGAFHPRLLTLEGAEVPDAATRSAASRWSLEVARRTSAPARLEVKVARPSALLEEPFVLWSGRRAPPAVEAADLRRLREYLRLGGSIVVDDRDPARGEFGRGVRGVLARALPDAAVVELPAAHVLYKSFYLLDGPSGLVAGPPTLSGIVRGKSLQVVFLSHDLLGALARTPEDAGWLYQPEPGGAEQRELAIRLAVNLALYVLCSDYKDDQVHAAHVMRRRGGRP
jgi:hypothetical protein